MRFPVSRSIAVETNAGVGTMTAFWAQLCGRVIAIDKEAAKLTHIRHENVETLCCGNQSEEARRQWLDAEIVDIDPHGDPWPIIREIAAKSRRPRIFIAFTDGSWWTRRWNKDGRRNIRDKFLELGLTNYHYERVDRGGVLYYGWIYIER